MRVLLTTSDYEKILRHAQEGLPYEACGLLAGEKVESAISPAAFSGTAADTGTGHVAGPAATPGASIRDVGPAATPDISIRDVGPDATPGASIRDVGPAATPDIFIRKVYPLSNPDQSAEHFSIDPREQLAAIKDMRANGLSPLGNFHSHPSTPARPSQEDIRLARDPAAIYMILSLATAPPTLRAFQVTGGRVQEAPVVIDSGRQSGTAESLPSHHT
jgi:proteasome lid subunit RPN8/RPN11